MNPDENMHLDPEFDAFLVSVSKMVIVILVAGLVLPIFIHVARHIWASKRAILCTMGGHEWTCVESQVQPPTETSATLEERKLECKHCSAKKMDVDWGLGR